MTARFEKIAFLSSGTPEADAALAKLISIYGNAAPEAADVVVALGVMASCSRPSTVSWGQKNRFTA